jgi:hypothetical protein
MFASHSTAKFVDNVESKAKNVSVFNEELRKKNAPKTCTVATMAHVDASYTWDGWVPQLVTKKNNFLRPVMRISDSNASLCVEPFFLTLSNS